MKSLFGDRRTLSLIIEQSQENVLRLEVAGKIMFLTVAEFVSKPLNEDEHYSASLALALNTIASRAVNSYCIISTCISRTSISTYLVTISRESGEAIYQRDVLCALIETLTNSSVTCRVLNAREAFNVIERCLGVKPKLSIFGSSASSSAVYELHRPASWPTPSILGYEDLEFVIRHLEKGKIRIGSLLENPSIEVALRDEHLLRHIAIFGSTGSGKSTTAAIIAAESSANGYTVFIVDWHGEYLTLLRNLNNILYTNPLQGTIPSALDLEQLIREETLTFIEILESALELTPAQAHILEDAVNYVKNKFTSGYLIDILVDIVQSSSASARWYTESREALLRKLKPLTSQYLHIRWDRCIRIPSKPNTVTVFDLSSIPNTRVKKALASLLIRSITLKAQYNELPKPILIVVDEAHNIFETRSPLSMLVAEVRKWSLGFVIATQAPSMISPTVIKNANTKIVHTLKSSQDINSVLAAIPTRRNLAQIVSSLKPGEALIALPELPIPLLIKIDISVLESQKHVGS